MRPDREWLEVTLRSVGDAVIATDTSGRVVFLNPIAEQLTGWGADDARGRAITDVFDVVDEATRRRVHNPALSALSAGQSQALANHTILIARDGTERGIEDTAAPIRDEEGNLFGAVLVFRDVTAERRVQRQREARLRVTEILATGPGSEAAEQAIVEALAATLVWDAASLWRTEGEALYRRVWWAAPDSGLESAMRAEARPLRRGEGLAGRAWQNRQVAWLDFGEAMLEGAAHGGVACPLTIDGEVQGALVLASRAAQRPDPELAETLSTVVAQLGEFVHRRRAQAEVQRAEANQRFLQQASASLADLVDYRSTLRRIARLAVPDFADWCAVDVERPDGTVERLAWMHQDPAKVDMVHAASARYTPDRQRRGAVYRVLSSQQPELVADITDDMLQRFARDAEHLRLLRELQPRSTMNVPFTGKQGVRGVLSFVAAESGRRYTRNDLETAQDLAKRAAIAIDNAILYERAREADRRKDEFLAILSHELRNPLAPIRTGLDLLARSPEAARASIPVMRRQLEHLVRLADDLLDVSRVTHGKVELRRERVALGSIVHAAVDGVRPAADEKAQTLSIASEAPISIDADPVRIEQVVTNLLSNAVKFTDPGGRIEVGVGSQNDFALIRVRDTGIGIEPGLLDEIFEPFVQGEATLDRSEGGLGIGLTLVRHLVELHGGTVAAQSAGPGAGSEFLVRLPVGTKPSPPKAGTHSFTPKAAGARRVLVVDDNTAAAELLGKLLGHLGPHRIDIAFDGRAALEKAAKIGPDVVFLDIGMPGMDGYAVARALRAQPQHARLVLVALTGYGQPGDRERAREAGFDLHLVKPASIDDLRRALAWRHEQPT